MHSTDNEERFCFISFITIIFQPCKIKLDGNGKAGHNSIQNDMNGNGKCYIVLESLLQCRQDRGEKS